VRAGSPALCSTVLLVETHDEINPGVTDAISGRFAGSHHLAMVSTGQTIDPSPPIDLCFLTASEVRSASREIRGRQSWLLLTPRNGPLRCDP
jgi:hypothetical protein